jgi:ribosome-dependent ATPase
MSGLLDPHGVGNSILLAVIAAARKIQQGEVTVLGRDIRSIRHRDAICPRIAYIL